MGVAKMKKWVNKKAALTERQVAMHVGIRRHGLFIPLGGSTPRHRMMMTKTGNRKHSTAHIHASRLRRLARR